MLYFLTSGILFGLSNGLSPGPLFLLVVSQTMAFGKKEGIKIAITPLITDLPIIVAALYFMKSLAALDIAMGIISIFGGFFIALLGYLGLKAKKFEHVSSNAPASIVKGITANILNPSPYIFWLTVGAPTVWEGFEKGIEFSAVFVASMYLCMIGSKITIALLIDRTRGMFNQKILVRINQGIGLLLMILSVKFFYDGWQYLINL